MTRRIVGSMLVVLSLGACTLIGPDGERTSAEPSPSPSPTPPPPSVAEPRVPEAPVTVVDAAGGATRALATSDAFLASSPVAVLAPADGPEQLRAASAAVALGAPLLLGDGAEVAAEIERLEAEMVVSFLGAEASAGEGTADGAAPDGPTSGEETTDEPTAGGAASPTATTGGADETTSDGTAPGQGAPTLAEQLEDDGVEVVDGTLADDALAGLLGLSEVVGVAPGAELAAVRGLDRTAPVLLVAAEPPSDPDAEAEADPPGTGTGSTTQTTDDPDVPEAGELPVAVTQADPVDDALLLSTGAVEDLASIATARSVGAAVQLVPGGDPRQESSVVQALAGHEATTVALGAEFGTVEDLTWKLTTAATGVELPGGGQVLFPGRRLVAIYGTPGTSALGVLGEQDLEGSIARAQKIVRAYRPLTEDTVVPAFEIIVTIASAGAGDDGNYSNELDPATFVPWIEAAQEAGVYVILDLQPGRTDFLTQAKRYEQLLRYPHVGLALDPEWRLEPDQVHLRQIGSVGIDEVNAVADWLATLTRENALPQKLFVLHQFSLRMIEDRDGLDTSHEELEVMIHADGQGSQPAKAGTWEALRRGAPEVSWGWKNFHDEDSPMLTPEQTYQVSPVPELVTYQ